MTVIAWRIVKERHAATALSGEGASRVGGRWNVPGVRMVYSSGSQALAVLETLVHLNPPIYFKYLVFRISFGEQSVETLRPAELPANWSEEPPAGAGQQIGTAWVKSGRSAVLAVPSVIVPDEWELPAQSRTSRFCHDRSGDHRGLSRSSLVCFKRMVCD